MTIGKKIKFVRKPRNMTQQELGIAAGLEEKGAANRIAQYECDYRNLQKEMLIDMAKAMNINPLNYVSNVPGSAEDIIQTFFWLDEDNRNYGLVDEFMREWMVRKQELSNKEITEAEYLEWKLNWPDNCDNCGMFEPKKGWRNE